MKIKILISSFLIIGMVLTMHSIVFANRDSVLSEKADVNIGVYYFDGWAGKNSSNAAWAKNAPTHLTYRMLTEFPEREPIWGWRDDSLEIMEQQIDLAADNGIKFFAFCWYWHGGTKGIDINAIMNDPLHTSLQLFLKAKNNHRMKFALLIANHGVFDIPGADGWGEASEFWASYFKNPQYMTVDGKPLLIVFNTASVTKSGITKMQEVALREGLPEIAVTACSKGDVNTGFTYRTQYNVKSKRFYEGKPERSNKLEYSDLMDAQKEYWQGSSQQPFIPIITAGWDKRPWESPTEKGGWYYAGRTPEKFKACLKEAIEWMDDHPNQATKERLMLIYAWNEFGEGGYIAPTKGDRNGEYLKAIRSLVK